MAIFGFQWENVIKYIAQRPSTKPQNILRFITYTCIPNLLTMKRQWSYGPI